MYPNQVQGNNPNPNPFLVQQEDEIDLKALLFNYLTYWPLIVIFAFLGVLVAFLFNRYTTPIYKVESTVLVVDDKPTLGADLFESAGLGIQGKSNIDNETGIIKSYSLAESAVSQMDLNVSYYKEGFLKVTQVYGNVPVYVSVDWTKPQLVGGMFRLEVIDESSFELSVEDDQFSVFQPKDPFYKSNFEGFELPKSIYSFGENIQGEYYEFKISQISALPGEVFFFKIIDTPSLALKMKNDLQVNPLNKQASILTLSLETPLRRLGENYINTLMDKYLERELEEKNQASENTIRFIEQQLSGITDSLQFSEKQLQDYRSKNKIFNLSQEGSIIFERLNDLEQERSQAELNLKYYQTLKS